jgi:hypothetical protein
MNVNGSNVETVVTVSNSPYELIRAFLVTPGDSPVIYYTFWPTVTIGNPISIPLNFYNTSNGDGGVSNVPNWGYINWVSQMNWYNNQMWVVGYIWGDDSYTARQFNLPTIMSIEWSNGTYTSRIWFQEQNEQTWFTVNYMALFGCSMYFDMTYTTSAIHKLAGKCVNLVTTDLNV